VCVDEVDYKKMLVYYLLQRNETITDDEIGDIPDAIVANKMK
jgi:hypothetical protein